MPQLVSPERLMRPLGRGRPSPFADAAAYWPFSTSRSLVGAPGPTLTFTRAGGAMQYLANGNLGWAPENIVENSAQIGSGGWTVESGVTVTLNDAPDPEGGNRMSKLENLGQDPTGRVFQVTGGMAPVGYAASVSIWVQKISTTGTLRVRNIGSPSNGDWSVDLSLMGSGTELLTENHAAVTVVTPWTIQGSNDGMSLEALTGTVDVYAYGGQFNRGVLQAHNLNASTNSAFYGPRFDYFPTGQSLGLLIEESRTNALLQSEDFNSGTWAKRGAVTVTPNDTTAPDGTMTADKIENLGAIAVDDMFQIASAGSFGNNVAIAPSFWIKKITTSGTLQVLDPVGGGGAAGLWQIDLSAIGSSWERITQSHPAVTVSTAFQSSSTGQGGIHFTSGTGPLDFHLWGAQEEQGAFPTSYIPTTTAQVVRAADVCDATDVTWFNSSAGAWFMQQSISGGPGTDGRFAMQADAGSDSSNYHRHIANTSANTIVYQSAPSVGNTADLNFGASQVGVTQKMAAAYALDDVAGSLNGGAIVSDTLYDPVTGVSNLRIGHRIAGNYINGHIAVFAFWPERKSNEFLQEVTT